MAFNRLLILTFNGASWEALAPWWAQQRLPTLQGFASSGASGELHALLPTFTYPNWATFWTGETPGQHGIFAFDTLTGHGVTGQLVDWTVLKRPTWLELASRHGRRVVCVDAPLTYPPRPVNGYLVSELVMRDAPDFTYPPELVAELRARFQPLHLPKSEQFFPNGGFRGLADVHGFAHKQIASIRQTGGVARYLLEKHPWDVAIIRFFATGPLQHALWHGVNPTHPAFDPAIHQALGTFFVALDEVVKDLVDVAKPTAVLVFSEHGFATCREIVNLARLLKERGLLSLSVGERLLRRLLATRGLWRLIQMADRAGGGLRERLSAPWKARGIFLDHKAIYLIGPDRRAIAKRLIEALESLRDPETDQSIVRKVWRVEELYGPSALGELEVLVVEFAQGYTGRTGDPDRPLLWPCVPNRDYLIGTHTQTGLWLFAGQGITPGQDVPASILDLPPTILAYLGIPIPEWMVGQVLPVLAVRQAR